MQTTESGSTLPSFLFTKPKGTLSLQFIFYLTAANLVTLNSSISICNMHRGVSYPATGPESKLVKLTKNDGIGSQESRLAPKLRQGQYNLIVMACYGLDWARC